MRFWLTISLCAMSMVGMSQTSIEHLYIIPGQLALVDSSQTPFTSFVSDPLGTEHNPILEANQGDSLLLWVHNLDSLSHHFTVEGLASTVVIPAGDSALTSLHLSASGIFIYRDPNSSNYASYMGLGGMLVVKDHPHASFYWNLREIDPTWNQTLSQGGSVNLGTYDPTFFLINERSAPFIDTNATARITGNVGDTLMIYIANHGIGTHSLHFHGYHCRLVQSSHSPQHQNWIKDTFPIYGNETLILELVPHQPGVYPVHDHNLVATMGNYIYPNGMFTTIMIAP